jgi:PAS domain S-box-containing protein
MPRLLTINALLFVAYLASGFAGLYLALPPGYVTLIWPPSGVVFAACIVFGARRVWPGIFAGALSVNLIIAGNLSGLGPAIGIALGSTMQAVIGAYLLRQSDLAVSLDSLSKMGSFWRIVLGACLIAPVIGNTVLVSFGILDIAQVPGSMISWWLGDSLGVLVFMPIAMAIIRPEAIWSKRRTQVGIPMAAGALLCVLIYNVVATDEIDHMVGDFSDSADLVMPKLSAFGDTAARALSAMAKLTAAPDGRDPATYLKNVNSVRTGFPFFQSFNWLPLLHVDQLEQFDREMATRLGRPYKTEPIKGFSFPADGIVAPVALIEPLQGNVAAQGRDLLSEPVRAEAINKVRNGAAIAASGKLRLVQDLDGPGGIIIMYPVKTDDGVMGIQAGVLNLRDLLKPLADLDKSQWHIKDISGNAPLAGTMDDIPSITESSVIGKYGIFVKRSFKVADRDMEITFYRKFVDFPRKTFSNPFIVIGMALFVTAALVQFMLIISADAERIEREVVLRTDELRQQIAIKDAAESALRASEQQYRQLIETAQEGIWVVDDQNVIQLANRRIGEILGIESAELIGTNIFYNVEAAERGNVIAKVASLRGGSATDIEIPFMRKSGARAWGLMSISPLFDSEQKYTGALGMVTDITRRKATEDELVIARDVAESATRAKSRFLSNMSHEIRTPLNGILGMLGMLKSPRSAESMKQILDLADTSARHLLRLANEILDISRLEAGKLNVELTTFSPTATFDFVVSMLKSRAIVGGNQLVYDVAPDMPAALIGDDGKIRQVAINLVGNALKFTANGTVTLALSGHRLEGDGFMLRVSVTDTGIGISKDAQEKIFSEFTQADESTVRRFGGTGLGLSICKNFVDLLGGEIRVESEPGLGSKFWFDVPTRIGEFASVLNGTDIGTAPDIPPMRVLVAEDNAINQLVIEHLLTRLGHHCDLVANGHEAVIAVTQAPYDVILMDAQMPEMDGEQAMRQIRAMAPPIGAIPIIMVTADAMAGDRERYIEVGADDYVSKPIDIDALAHALARTSRGRGDTPPANAADVLQEISPGLDVEPRTGPSKFGSILAKLESLDKNDPDDPRG